jgi:hypothetical protein
MRSRFEIPPAPHFSKGEILKLMAVGHCPKKERFNLIAVTLDKDGRKKCLI